MTHEYGLDGVTWRKSSFSGGGGASGGNSVEVAALSDGRIAVRNSTDPKAGALVFTPAEMDAWVQGCKAGEFDDLAQTQPEASGLEYIAVPRTV